ncbi:MAG: rhodanese-like domain-containing protein [Flavobacteriales bacterium]
MQEITPEQFKEKVSKKEEFQLIDIREEFEVEYCGINGEHIPMAEILENVDKIRKDIPVIFHCQAGNRSKAVIYMLEKKHGFTNLYNLEGGVKGYASDIDDSLNCY